MILLSEHLLPSSWIYALYWPLILVDLMLKAQPLCTGAESNLGDRVLGEVEENSFIALSGKGGHRGSCSEKSMYPNPGGFDEEFYSSGSKVGLLIRLGGVQSLHSFNLISGGLLISMSFSDSFNLASGGFLVAPPLITNCSNLSFGTQGRSWRLESVPRNKKWGTERHLCPGTPQGPAQFHFMHPLRYYCLRYPQIFTYILHFSQILWLSISSMAMFIW